MTIIAGFRCKDGIVLCSDSELTFGDRFKSPLGAKIAQSYEEKYTLISAAAGYIDYAESLWEDILRDIDTSDKKFETIRRLIAENLKRFYHDHIYPAQLSELDIRLLFALRTQEGEVGLLKTAASALLTGDEFEIAGSGAPLGNYLVHTLTGYKRIDVNEGEILAIQIVKQAKKFVPYCGGKTNVWILRPDGRVQQVGDARIEGIESYLDGVEQGYGPTLLKESAKKIAHFMATRPRPKEKED